MNRHILVVEDQVDNRQILRDLLGNAGYELTEAENVRRRSPPSPSGGRTSHPNCRSWGL
jgi:response regulator RpfG family c-di-GMP phosphodiesterase